VKYAGPVTRQQQPVLLDGGLATELEAAGAVLDSSLWSAALLQSDPGAIRAAHRAYLDAGAEVVTSASYQASRAGFGRLGLASAEADKLIVSSVQLAREACDAFAACHPAMPPRRVAASVGPYGAILHDGSEYTGNYDVSTADLRLFHAGRLLLLDGAGADLLAVETLPSLAEARVLAALLADCRTPAWVSFSCRDERSINDGSRIEVAARLFAGHPTVFALGVNCTPPRFLPSLIERLRDSVPDKILLAYPNAGEVYEAATGEWSGTADTARFVDAAADWFAAGATWIGGCCRIGPAHIAALRARWPAG
jgi:homocysteine S-methyltransferase